MARTIGIDLGTTNCCMSVFEAGHPVVIPNAEGQHTTPSVVAFTADGQTLVGEAARRQAAANPAGTIRSIKRSMGTDLVLELGENRLRPEDVSALILKKLRADAQAWLGDEVGSAVITVPAYFTDDQRQATRRAGEQAGLNVLRIINEPTAAALSFGLQKSADQTLLVYDLGGGTFDVSILEMTGGVLRVVSTAGNNRLGGDDFDQVVADWIGARFHEQTGHSLKGDPSAAQRVLEAAEAAKIELSDAEEAVIRLPYLAEAGGAPLHFEATLTRAEFEKMTAHLVRATIGLLQDALTAAGMEPYGFDALLLVGGSTRMPAVRAAVTTYIRAPLAQGVDPDECVAVGACIQGGILSGDVAGMLLLDVLPMSLGLETVGGGFEIIVPRSTALPVSRSRTFTTAVNFQPGVDLKICQGESPAAANNRFLGKYTFTGIRRAFSGAPRIEVTFYVDVNGILSVTAHDLGSQKELNLTVDSTQPAKAGGDGRPAEASAPEPSREQVEALLKQAQETLEALDPVRDYGRRAALEAAVGKTRKALHGKDLNAALFFGDVLRHELARPDDPTPKPEAPRRGLHLPWKK